MTDAGREARDRILAALPVTEHRMDLAGTPTAVAVGGDGPPMVLLHGPGESALWWMRVVPGLVASHRVIVPDLPGHGGSGMPDRRLDAPYLIEWLEGLVTRTCTTPPVLVGHTLGGAVAARFAIARPDRVAHLVLVDALGLARFFPAPRFAYEFLRFKARPTEERYERFLAQCLLEPDPLRLAMGPTWAPFVATNVAAARSPVTMAAADEMMRHIGTPRIPPGDLRRIRVPTALIWGRHDKATRVRVAEAASVRYGWPLHVIEDARDDPKFERPEAFLAALSRVIGSKPQDARAAPVARAASPA